MKQKNKDRLAALTEQLQDAEENLGDIEVRNACLAKADFLCSIGEPMTAAKPARACYPGGTVDIMPLTRQCKHQ